MLNGVVPSKGVFKNASAIAVTGNQKLCGGIQELKLLPCPINVNKQRKHLDLRLIVVIICVVVLLFLFLSVLAIYRMRKRNRKKSWKSHSSLPRIDWFPKVSHQSLYAASDGFSANNLIGSGSFGSVYKGILEFEQELVAIKVLNLQRKGADKSFIAECNALRNIRHQNLVKILTCCSSRDNKGQPFKALVYRYMKSGCLESWLHQERVTEKQARILDLGQRLNVVIDIAAALHYLHIECEQTIVHCDLKPSNILLDDDMTAHVGDFGLTRLLSTINGIPDNHTSTIAIKGTVGYAPPEYGMGFEVSTRGDMYSFGILVLEILTRRRPTDEIFKEDYNLHNHVRVALPNNILEIMDPALLPKGSENKTTTTDQAESIVEEPTDLHPTDNKCLLSLCKIGLACSMESPHERMTVEDVFKEFNLISKSFLADGIMERDQVKELVTQEKPL